MRSPAAQSGKRAAYPAFKPSGVEWLGEIPEHWDPVRLRYRAKINPIRSEINGLPDTLDVSFVPMESVHEYGGLALVQSRPLAEVSTGYTYFRDGDVLAAKITPCFENGKGAIAQELMNGIGFGTTELHVLRCHPSIDHHFLFYVTISHAFRNLGAAEMYGAGGQKRVPEDFIKDFRQPVPPISEQQAIAAFLDRETARIDALIEKKQRQIELLQEKRSAMISHAVTKGLDPKAKMKDSGIEWLGQIPAHWRTTRLKYASVKIVDCPHETPTYSEDGEYAVIRTADLTSGVLNLDKVYRVDTKEYILRVRRERIISGDILYSREGERWGFAASSPKTPVVCLGQRMMQFRAGTRYSARFLMWHLNARSVYEQGAIDIVGATSPHVNVETIKNYRLCEPPIQEQNAIASSLDRRAGQIDAIVFRVEESINLLREYRNVLISSVVTGKIDVR